MTKQLYESDYRSNRSFIEAAYNGIDPLTKAIKTAITDLSGAKDNIEDVKKAEAEYWEIIEIGAKKESIKIKLEDAGPDQKKPNADEFYGAYHGLVLKYVKDSKAAETLMEEVKKIDEQEIEYRLGRVLGYLEKNKVIDGFGPGMTFNDKGEKSIDAKEYILQAICPFDSEKITELYNEGVFSSEPTSAKPTKPSNKPASGQKESEKPIANDIFGDFEENDN